MRARPETRELSAVARRALGLAGATLALAALVATRAPAAVYGDDNRRAWFLAPGALHPAMARQDGALRAMAASGGVLCADGMLFTGVVIDVRSLSAAFGQPVLLTTAHTFVDEYGHSRGTCRFVPRGGGGRGYELGFVQTGLGPDAVRKPADARDWAFAIVLGVVPGAIAEAPVAFGEQTDFDRQRENPSDWMAVSYAARLRDVAWATDCRPDDKRAYPDFAATDPDSADFTRMIVHDCDFAGGASGGPLLRRTAAGWRVVAIHVGDTGREKRGESGSVWYAPPQAFNFSRRLDGVLESALVDYLGVLDQVVDRRRCARAACQKPPLPRMLTANTAHRIVSESPVCDHNAAVSTGASAAAIIIGAPITPMVRP